jgi:CelD/BcsL family acetyltransferase involved in cellulose biosynthesis
VPIVERKSLGDLAPAWDELAGAAPVPSPFLRSWWLESSGGPGSTFLLVLSGDQLLGGLAVERDTRFGVERVRMMGSGDLGPDHLDLVAAPEVQSTVESALVDWFTRPGGRFVDLAGVVEGAYLESVVAQMGGRQWIESATAPWVELKGDYEEYRSSLPSRLRNGLARTSSRLKRLGVRYHVVEPEESEEAIEWLRRLHRLSWGPESTFLPAFPRFARAASTGIAKRELVIHQLVAGNEVIAIQAWFEVGDRASFYQSGRNVVDPQWRGAGNVLHAFVAERACQLGFRELDFLRGSEQYKLEWADRSRPLVEYLVAKGSRGRVLATAREARTHLEGSLSSHRPSWQHLNL